MRRRLGRPEDPQSRVSEVVHHAFGKRSFRTHDRKADALALRERDQIRDRGQGDVAELALARRAGVAGRDEDFRNRLDCAIFHASACSRPPPPMTRIFIAAAHASACFPTHTCGAKATLLGKCTRWRVVTASGESAARR